MPGCVRNRGCRVLRNEAPSELKVHHCQVAQKDHDESVRQYAHVFCRRDKGVCVARELWDLPKDHRAGIIAHELGHLLAGPRGSEQDADDAFERVSGYKIRYKDGPWGERLQYVGPEAARFIDANFPVFEVKRKK